MTYQRNMDTFGPEDMAIPEVKLIQNVGGSEAKDQGAVPGDFYSNITGEVIKGHEGFDIIVVDIQKNRTYWGRTEIEEDPPICASLDTRTSILGDSCDECPHDARCDTPWLIDATERRTKCLLNFNVLAINAANSMPLLMRVSGISTQAVRELITQLRLNKHLKGQYHRAVIHVGSMAKKTASGEAFALQLRAKELLTDAALVEEFKMQSRQLLGTVIGIPETAELVKDEVAEAGIPKQIDTEPIAASAILEPLVRATATQAPPPTLPPQKHTPAPTVQPPVKKVEAPAEEPVPSEPGVDVEF